MSKASQRYFELQEQAEFYDQDLDFETLKFIPKKQPTKKPAWLEKHLDRPVDFDTNIDIDRGE